MITLHTLKKHPKSTHRKKVVGRGLGSGHGTYSTRGGKGQTARTGHSKMPAGFEGGRQPLVRQLPKNRGFRSPNAKPVTVRLSVLAQKFSAGETVTVAELKKRKVVSADTAAVKVVGAAKLGFALAVLVPISENSGKLVLAAGGTIKK